MTARQHWPLWCIVWLACSAGCEVLRPWSPEQLWKSSAGSGTKPPASTVQASTTGLSVELWRLRSDWSPTREWAATIDGLPPAAELRWLYPDWPTALRDSLRVAETVSGDATPAKPSSEEPDLEILQVSSAELATSELRNHRTIPVHDLLRLSERDDLCGLQATILLAQLLPESSSQLTPRLVRTVKNESAPLAVSQINRLASLTPFKSAKEADQPTSAGYSTRLRCAAAEAWCLILSCSADPEAMSEPLRYIAQPDLPEELRAELWLGIARTVPPGRIPPLVEAVTTLNSAPTEPSLQKSTTLSLATRQSIIQACLVYASRHPKEVAAANGQLETSPLSPGDLSCLAQANESILRGMYGEWLAVSRHPQAFSQLAQQTNDLDPQNQLRAYRALGLLHTDEARQFLRDKLKQNEELRCIAVLEALATWGPDDLEPVAADPAPAVREALVRSLRQHHNPASVQLVETALQTGPEGRVEREVLTLVRNWPPLLARQAGLILLRRGSTATRTQVLTLLKADHPELTAFPVQGSAAEREQAATILAQSWQTSARSGTMLTSNTSHITTGIDARQTAPPPPDWLPWLTGTRPAPKTPEELAERSAAFLSLTRFDVPLIEQHLPQTAPELRTWLQADILPKISPAYAALATLELPLVQSRRQAAQSLAELAAQSPLSEPVWQQLRLHMQREQDREIWWRMMQLAHQQPGTEAAQLAQLAIHHQWPDVRRLGCSYFGTHGRPEHAVWILPLLQDPNPEIQRLAITAAVTCSHPVMLDGAASGTEPVGTSPGGLRPWLSSPDLSLRLQAATGMSRFGDVPAMRVLAELADCDDWQIRQQAVRSMAGTGQSRFVEKLVAVIWTERNDVVKLTALESLRRLVPPSDWPSGLSSSQKPHQQIELWATWWSSRNTPATVGFQTSAVSSSYRVAPASSLPAGSTHAFLEQRVSDSVAR